MANDLKYYKERYERRKEEMLSDKSICKENRELFKKFFEWEETKLKRSNNLSQLGKGTYKTLDYYITKFSNVNKWFKNKAWVKLTKEDIKKVYDDLEEGRIKNGRGDRYEDLKSYYSKVFRSKPFEMAGKVQLVKEVIEFSPRRNNEEVRFIAEETFRKIVDVVIRPDQKLLCWLAFDIGENINTLLELKKRDFFQEKNPDTKDPEYRINLPREELKKTRVARSEITMYKETVEFIEIVLNQKREIEVNGEKRLVPLQDDDKIFHFEYKMAEKFLRRAVEIVGAKCIPKGQRVTWKDLRCSMACNFLKQDWTVDEVNARLGHKPSSREIDKYVNFLAINRHRPKLKAYKFSMQKLESDLDAKGQELKYATEKIKRQEADIEALKKSISGVEKFMQKQIAINAKN